MRGTGPIFNKKVSLHTLVFLIYGAVIITVTNNKIHLVTLGLCVDAIGSTITYLGMPYTSTLILVKIPYVVNRISNITFAFRWFPSVFFALIIFDADIIFQKSAV